MGSTKAKSNIVLYNALNKRKKQEVKQEEYHEKMLAERKNGIGGSDVAGIMGLSKWSSALQIYMSKVEDWTIEDNEYMYWGRKLEDIIAEEFMRRTKYKVRRINKTLKDDKHSILMANIDRIVLSEDAGLECKNASAYRTKDFKDTIPNDYMLQCQHYMYVTKKNKWFLAVLIGGNYFKWITINRDNELIGKIIDACLAFWNKHIIPKNPPLACFNDEGLLKEMYPESNKKTIEFSNDNYYEKYVEKYFLINNEIKALEKERKGIGAIIKQDMGQNEIALCNDIKVSWPTIESMRLDYNKLKADGLYNKYLLPSFSRRFDVKKIG